MARCSRKLLRYGAPAAVFACAVAFLAAGGPAGLAWTLIVLSLGSAVPRANAVAPPSDRPRQDWTHGRRNPDAVSQRHAAESRRTLCGPR